MKVTVLLPIIIRKILTIIIIRTLSLVIFPTGKATDQCVLYNNTYCNIHTTATLYTRLYRFA